MVVMYHIKNTLLLTCWSLNVCNDTLYTFQWVIDTTFSSREEVEINCSILHIGCSWQQNLCIYAIKRWAEAWKTKPNRDLRQCYCSVHLLNFSHAIQANIILKALLCRRSETKEVWKRCKKINRGVNLTLRAQRKAGPETYRKKTKHNNLSNFLEDMQMY